MPLSMLALALQDWHMLHANEAWRQLTGAELQRGVSTGLWESFEFLSAQPQVRQDVKSLGL